MPASLLLLVHGVAAILPCEYDHDCEFNGVCTSGVCVCDPEWRGPTCGKLRLGEPSYAYGGPDTDVTSWGAGPPVLDPQTGNWYLFVTEIANHCGLSEWMHGSTIVRAVSDNPRGPFQREEVVIGVQSHNPYYVYDPVTNTHLLYHIGQGDEGATGEYLRYDCSAGTTPMDSTEDKHRLRGQSRASTRTASLQPERAYVYANWTGNITTRSNKTTTNLDQIYTAKPRIHRAYSLTGSWEPVNVADKPDLGAQDVPYGFDNPAAFIFPNGSTLMLFRRYLGLDDSKIYLSRADSYVGPYSLEQPAGDFGPSSGNHEDPCIWQDSRGHFHALFHFSASHAYSADGLVWKWGSDDAWDGGVLDGVELLDAERPRMMWDEARQRPGLLFFASGGRDQPTSKGEGKKGFTVVRAILH